MMKLFVYLMIAFSPFTAISKPAKDSSKYSKSLVWTPDRNQKAPVWRLSDADFSNKFKHLENANELTAKAKPGKADLETGEEKPLNNSDENDSEIGE